MTLQEEALLRYPKGVQFNNSNLPSVTGKQPTTVSLGILYTSSSWLPGDISIVTGVPGCSRVVYRDGVWADIVDFDWKYYLSVLAEKYSEGTQYIPLNSDGTKRGLFEHAAFSPRIYGAGIDVGPGYIAVRNSTGLYFAKTKLEFIQSQTVQNQNNGRTDTIDNLSICSEPEQDRNPKELGAIAICSRIRKISLGHFEIGHSTEPCFSPR